MADNDAVLLAQGQKVSEVKEELSGSESEESR